MIYAGLVKIGEVLGYDPTTMSAVIKTKETGGVIHNVVCLFDRFDADNNAYSFRAPSAKAPCLYTTIGQTTYLLGLFSPTNFNQESAKLVNSIWGNTDNRTPVNMKNYENIRDGNYVDQTSMGAEESFFDSMKKIIMSPNKLSSIWNLVNCVWENVCTIFRLTSGPMDVYCEVNENDETVTTIKVRKEVKEKAGISIINLQMGKLDTEDIIKLKINGKDLLHIDPERNVKIFAKQIDLNADQVNYNVNKEFNCLNVQTVKLP